jgi:iron(III)-enterobactin esterase
MLKNYAIYESLYYLQMPDSANGRALLSETTSELLHLPPIYKSIRVNQLLLEKMIKENVLELESDILKRTVTIEVLQRDQPTLEPLHLLLLNDGQELKNLKLAETLEDLYAKKKIGSLLVIGIHAGERMQEYGVAGRPDYKKRGSKASDYNNFIVQELLPFSYQLAGVESFASINFAGFSLGALSAFDIVWNNPEIFDRVGAFSGSFWWRSTATGKKYNNDTSRIAHQMVKNTSTKPQLQFLFQAGTQDETADRNKNGIIDSIDDTVDLIKELEMKGYSRPDDIKYIEVVGGKHDIETWSKVLPKFLLWAFSNSAI